MIPQVKLSKANGNTGVVRPGDEGVLAIIASSATGSTNQPASYTRPEDMLLAGGPGYGRLTSFAAYTLAVAQNPIVAIKPTTATAGAYGAIAQTGTGATVATGDGSVLPLDTWNVLVTCVTGGTVGNAGIVYTTSLDGGTTTSAPQQLAAATSITIPGTGVKVNLTAASWVAGDTIAFVTTPPYATTSDLTNALEALRVTSLPWDGVLVDATASAAMVAELDTWLAGLEAVGKYKWAAVNFRMKASGESEATYQAAIAAIMVNVATDRVLVCADGADMLDYFAGVLVPRPTSLYCAARAEAVDLAEAASFVGRGALTNAAINDPRANPKYHDEQKYPGIDALQVTTLRSFPRQSGVFVTNPRLGSSPTSDYQFLQQLRVMNEACSVAYDELTTQLSKGVTKNPKVGPAGQVYISEESAGAIEALVNGALTGPMKGRCTDYRFTLNRDDDISSNQLAKVTGKLQVEALAYIGEFDVVASFVKTIVAPLAA